MSCDKDLLWNIVEYRVQGSSRVRHLVVRKSYRHNNGSIIYEALNAFRILTECNMKLEVE